MLHSALESAPFGMPAKPHHYVVRDRIQAGMSDGVVLVQATLRGGSLYASRAILEYGRWLQVARRTDSSEAFDANDILLDGNINNIYRLFKKKIKGKLKITEL